MPFSSPAAAAAAARVFNLTEIRLRLPAAGAAAAAEHLNRAPAKEAEDGAAQADG